MARATALRLGNAGWRLTLAGRDLEALAKTAEDLRIRTGAQVEVAHADVADLQAAPQLLDKAGLPDAVLVFAGLMTQESGVQTPVSEMAAMMQTNYVGVCAMLQTYADAMVKAGKKGCLLAASSVAGDRGRATNYAYGSSKAGLTAFLSGLRQSLNGTGIRVVTLIPGFVRTKMTDGLPLPPLVTAQPEEVAKAVEKSIDRGREVVYVRGIWRWIMRIIRTTPESVFKRMRL